MTAREILNSFTLDDLPDLDVVVIGALELLTEADLPESNTPFRRPLVIGSGNAAATGRILFRNNDAIFADESSYQNALARVPEIDGIVLISASGGKHAKLIAEALDQDKRPKILLTNNPKAPAAAYFSKDRIRIFPKNREPYTYNTSTYLSMILADTDERAGEIKQFIEGIEDNVNFANYSSFTFILPSQFTELREMLRTKFDELFGPKLIGRIFIEEEIKHAKTVVPDNKELFISFGVENNQYGLPVNRLPIVLSNNADYGTGMAISYYIVGLIQKAHPPHFKEHIANYCEQASAVFNQDIKPIVE